MQTVEFAHFAAMATIFFLLVRGVQILTRNSMPWVSQTLGATFG